MILPIFEYYQCHYFHKKYKNNSSLLNFKWDFRRVKKLIKLHKREPLNISKVLWSKSFRNLLQLPGYLPLTWRAGPMHVTRSVTLKVQITKSNISLVHINEKCYTFYFSSSFSISLWSRPLHQYKMIFFQLKLYNTKIGQLILFSSDIK